MAKKTYVTAWMDLDDEGDVVIEFGASQGTSGTENVFTFAEGFPADIRTLIEAQCDDTDLASMDTSGDFVITLAEYQAWLPNNPWFDSGN